jgi:hypothetical protein
VIILGGIMIAKLTSRTVGFLLMDVEVIVGPNNGYVSYTMKTAERFLSKFV